MTAMKGGDHSESETNFAAASSFADDLPEASSVFVKEGFVEGLRDGRQAGYNGGFAEGMAVGVELGKELGGYMGRLFSELHGCGFEGGGGGRDGRLSSPPSGDDGEAPPLLIRKISKAIELIQHFPLSNEEDAEKDSKLAQIRAKMREINASLSSISGGSDKRQQRRHVSSTTTTAALEGKTAGISKDW